MQVAVGARVLVVDDDEHLGRALERALRLEGFHVRLERDGSGALGAAGVWRPDVVVMDIGLPDVNGRAVIARMRASSQTLPICVLSARDTVDDRVAGLQAGADDYLVKPFAIYELVARLRALLRRAHEFSQPLAENRLVISDMVIDMLERRAWRSGRDLQLTSREFELLETFARNRRQVLSREMLLANVWGDGVDPLGKVVDVYVGKLRHKLEDAGDDRCLHTVHGIGFMLR